MPLVLTGHARSFAHMLTARQGERLPQWLDAVRTPERFSPNRAFFVAELTNLMSVGLPMATDVRHMIVADVIALLLADWEIKGTSPDGADLHLCGLLLTSPGEAPTLLAYIIDSPYGTRFRERT